MKNQYIGGNCLKMREGGELGQFVDLRMGLAKRRGGGVFEGSRVGLIPQSMHTMV